MSDCRRCPSNLNKTHPQHPQMFQPTGGQGGSCTSRGSNRLVRSAPPCGKSQSRISARPSAIREQVSFGPGRNVFGPPLDNTPILRGPDKLRPKTARNLMDEYQSHPSERSITSTKKEESLIEWFDRTAEEELMKRMDHSTVITNDILDPGSRMSFSHSISMPRSKSYSPEIVESSTSGIDIQAMLRGEQNTELLEAVDKLAKAEAMCNFAGAVKAAEHAAAMAPPELAEEAAAAGAAGFRAEVSGIVKQAIPGPRPVEVIGYVGITRPKRPKKPIY